MSRYPAERGRGPYAAAAAGPSLWHHGVRLKTCPATCWDARMRHGRRGAVGITVSLFRFEEKERAGECRRGGGGRKGVQGGAKWRTKQLPEPRLEPRLGAPAGGPGGGAMVRGQAEPADCKERRARAQSTPARRTEGGALQPGDQRGRRQCNLKRTADAGKEGSPGGRRRHGGLRVGHGYPATMWVR